MSSRDEDRAAPGTAPAPRRDEDDQDEGPGGPVFNGKAVLLLALFIAVAIGVGFLLQ